MNAEWLNALPHAPDYRWNWAALRRTAIGPWMDALKRTPQNPKWHGEGDAWAHTQLVCESLASLAEFRILPIRQQRAAALAALLHDVGKIPATKCEDGQWVSPGHSAAGASMARELLWTEFGLCGAEEARQLRETVCALIRGHMVPVHLWEQEHPERLLGRMAANAQLLPDYSVALLCLLSEADIRGRIAPDTNELLEGVQLCREEAEKAGCLHQPIAFTSDHAQHVWLSGGNVWPGQTLYDDTWGEVILMCGLPGTGKDTWIARHHPGLPVVSLDDLRREMDVSPTDHQGAVAQAALEQARVHLRAKQPFVWNATCLTSMMRLKQIRLFESYGARVRIVYLETQWDENLRRNQSRSAAVPETVIGRMLKSLNPPQRHEAQRVEWLSV